MTTPTKKKYRVTVETKYEVVTDDASTYVHDKDYMLEALRELEEKSQEKPGSSHRLSSYSRRSQIEEVVDSSIVWSGGLSCAPLSGDKQLVKFVKE